MEEFSTVIRLVNVQIHNHQKIIQNAVGVGNEPTPVS